jgi:uncharacterized membrane protein SpoIIM required for sporulation
MTAMLRSSKFRKEREGTWRKLEALVARAEKRGVRSLTGQEVASLATLYRATVSSLSVARTISLDRNLLQYLESLCQRGYFVVYGTQRRSRDVMADFFLRDFPAAVRTLKWHVVLAAVVFLAGVVVAWGLVAQDPSRYYAFIDAELAGDRSPAASTESLREQLFEGEDTSGDDLTAFSAFLFQNNARVGIFSFALGILAGLPVFFLMGYNGLMLGAISWLYCSRGLGFEWWGWLLPHGVTELLAVVLCGGAGFALAQGLLFPGARRRLDSLAHRGRQAGVVVLGAVCMLFLAGLIEGIFRQRVTHAGARYFVIGVTTLFWILYFGFGGRRRRRT